MGNEGRLVWTIGYGGRTSGDFLGDCQAYGITHVLDVRTHPHSFRWPEFSAGLLGVWLPREGIEYVYMGGGFGGRPEKGVGCRVADIQQATDSKAYAQRPAFRRTLLEFRQLMESPEVVPVLMCAERHPQECHRARLLAPALAAEGFLVRHIRADGTDVDQDELPLPHQARGLF